MVIFQLLFFTLTLIGPSLWGSAITSHATVYFSPEDPLEKRLIELIEKETSSIYVCIYTFSHRPISKALIEAHKRGVEVAVVVDRFSVKPKSSLQNLSEAGIPVYVWDPVKRKQVQRPLMHNKFCVFGSDTVWTGSFDFNEVSKLHQENAIVLQNAALASAYKGQFHTIKLRSCIPLTSYMTLKPKRITSRQKNKSFSTASGGKFPKNRS